MEDIIIIGVVALFVIVGLRSAKKHFKGQGGCCGGSAPVPKQNKKLEHVIAKKTIVIEGMTCDHCKNWVEKSINQIDGAAAKVNLQKKVAVVSLEKEVPEEELRQAVEKAGFQVVEIR